MRPSLQALARASTGYQVNAPHRATSPYGRTPNPGGRPYGYIVMARFDFPTADRALWVAPTGAFLTRAEGEQHVAIPV